MSGHLSDQEQKQMLKDWWKEYGSAVILAVLVFFAGNFGLRYWHKHKIQQESQASIAYTQMLNSVHQNKVNEMQLYASKLQKDYARSPYASFATLALAKNYVQNNKLSQAAESLQWVIDHAKSKSLQQIARLRLARILLAEGKAQNALDTIEKIVDEGYASAIYELRGDILLQMGDKEKAAQSYQMAKDALKDRDVKSPLLNLKV
jgi:predicted negative regulator of RcsB-dependent stress response